MKIKQRHFIRKSELRPLKDEILKQYDQKFVDQIFPKKSNVEIIQTEAGDTLYAINNVLKLFKSEDGYIPVLTLLLNKQVDLKTIVVDFGAIRYVANGADIMRPGILKSEIFREGDIVSVQENKYKKFIAVGIALVEESHLKKMKKGVVLKNYHYIGDNFWEAYKQIIG